MDAYAEDPNKPAHSCGERMNTTSSTSSRSRKRINKQGVPQGRLFYSDLVRDRRWTLGRRIIEALMWLRGSATPSELARLLNASRASISMALKRLEKRGLVRLIKAGRRTVVVELNDPSAPFTETALTAKAPEDGFVPVLVGGEVWLDNVRGWVGGRYVGGDRGVRLRPGRLAWFDRVSYAEVGVLFGVGRVPLGGVQVYWSGRDGRLVVEARPRRGVVRRGASPFRVAVDAFAAGVVACLEALVRMADHEPAANRALLQVLGWIRRRFGGLVC